MIQKSEDSLTTATSWIIKNRCSIDIWFRLHQSTTFIWCIPIDHFRRNYHKNENSNIISCQRVDSLGNDPICSHSNTIQQNNSSAQSFAMILINESSTRYITGDYQSSRCGATSSTFGFFLRVINNLLSYV
jgi:hypothetical protein